MKVTGVGSGARSRRAGAMDLTIPGNVKPDGLVVEGVPVGVEALEGVLVARVVSVHGGIVLMTEDDA